MLCLRSCITPFFSFEMVSEFLVELWLTTLEGQREEYGKPQTHVASSASLLVSVVGARVWTFLELYLTHPWEFSEDFLLRLCL